MAAARQPQHLSNALSEFIAVRGLARTRSDAQLEAIWKDVAGSVVASQTKVQKIKRGVMQVNVSNSTLLSELAMFHKISLLKGLREKHPELNVHELKFRLQSNSQKSAEN
jgi:predicted nucleic acid-binding Zn ribbon protein